MIAAGHAIEKLGGKPVMNTITLELDLPETVYQQLEKQSQQVRKTTIQIAVEAIMDYLQRETKLAVGREMLLRLPDEAQQHDDIPPQNLESSPGGKS